MLTITRKLEFDAGHRIPDHKSQCRNLHGHRYTLEITLIGEVIQAEGNSDNGMIMDFSDIKAIAKEHLVDVWDHAFLVYEKDTAVRDFLASLDVVAQGGTVIDPTVAQVLMSSGRSGLGELTPREREVLELMSRGKSNKDIAAELVLSAAAVAKHVSNIFTKLRLDPGEDNRRVKAILEYLSAHR